MMRISFYLDKALKFFTLPVPIKNLYANFPNQILFNCLLSSYLQETFEIQKILNSLRAQKKI